MSDAVDLLAGHGVDSKRRWRANRTKAEKAFGLVGGQTATFGRQPITAAAIAVGFRTPQSRQARRKSFDDAVEACRGPSFTLPDVRLSMSCMMP